MSTDWITLQTLAVAEFGRRVAAVTDWDAPTPDSEWTTRDLVAHVVDEQRWIPKLLTGCDHEQAAADLEPIGDDLLAEWQRHSSAAIEAWQRTPKDTPVHLSTDVVQAGEYLAEQTSDITIHTWDLARPAATNTCRTSSSMRCGRTSSRRSSPSRRPGCTRLQCRWTTTLPCRSVCSR